LVLLIAYDDDVADDDGNNIDEKIPHPCMLLYLDKLQLFIEE